MLISELNDRTRQGFLEFAWRQWAQAGVSANVVSFDHWTIDPEALILFTIQVAQDDPRLFDEMLDWLSSNRRLVTIQRLENLAARFPIDPLLVDAVVAWAEESRPSRKVKDRGRRDRRFENRPLFNPHVLSFVSEPDPTFAQYGYIRPRVVRSDKSRAPDVDIPANFVFQLRHLFGPGSRSEVIRILLTFSEGPLDAARISDEVGFAKRNVNDTLAGLATSRAVKARWVRNERVFTAHRNEWATLLEVGPSAEYIPEFVSWVHLFPASMKIMDWLKSEAETSDSEYLISSQARDLMERVAHDLEVVGLDVSPRRPTHGAAYWSTFEETVESILAKMGVN
jgi:hypothetical protein